MLIFIAWIFIVSAIVIASYVYYDTLKRPQSMKIMNAVWVLTALWSSFGALFLYNKWSRKDLKNTMESMNMSSMKMPSDMSEMKMPSMDMPSKMEAGVSMSTPMPDVRQSMLRSVALSALHCGAGCALADVVGEGITFLFPLVIGGSLIVGSWTLDFVLALTFGIFFQYKAMEQMQPAMKWQKLVGKAAKADLLSLISWQVGMYGWMAICYFVIFPQGSLQKDSATFWFMMQIAMFAGFCTALPVNYLLLKLGIKKAM